MIPYVFYLLTYLFGGWTLVNAIGSRSWPAFAVALGLLGVTSVLLWKAGR